MCVWSASQAPAPAAAVTVTSPAKEGDGDDDERGADEEHEVDDSKLKLPGVKLADVKVATHEEDEDVVYKQCVPRAKQASHAIQVPSQHLGHYKHSVTAPPPTHSNDA